MCTAYIYLPTYSYLPTYLTTYLPTYLPTDLFKDLPTYLLISTYIPNYIPTYISTYIPTYRPIYRPTYQPMFLWVCLCVNISHFELIFSGTNLKMFFFYFLQSSLSLSPFSLNWVWNHICSFSAESADRELLWWESNGVNNSSLSLVWLEKITNKVDTTW